uniref:60S ribosomal protein L18a-like protein n=1 Tax=Erigeron canadensis TaxID=72917 RepID=UPI001CB9C694|nr:60S ribosomal protein L18a-like protein [Erigeron canadensis]
MSEKEESKNRGAAVYPPNQQQPSPSAPPSEQQAYYNYQNYYGTFQGVANHPQQPPAYPPSSQQQSYQPPLGFPQPFPPPQQHAHHHQQQQPYYHHGYQTTVPGIVIASGTPVLVERRTLPCCGCGIGWFLFFLGFFFGAVPWYIGAFILMCVRVDYREKAGLVACTIAAFLVLIAVSLGVQRARYDW